MKDGENREPTQYCTCWTTAVCNGGDSKKRCRENGCAPRAWPPKLKNPVFRKIYVIGRLANPDVQVVAALLRQHFPDWEVFDDWQAAHPEADAAWRRYELARGRTYEQALSAYAGQSVFSFDKKHLNQSTHALLVLPAGRSGHLELGYMAGRGAKTAILLDAEYDRWDVMYAFADTVATGLGTIIEEWKQ